MSLGTIGGTDPQLTEYSRQDNIGLTCPYQLVLLVSVCPRPIGLISEVWQVVSIVSAATRTAGAGLEY